MQQEVELTPREQAQIDAAFAKTPSLFHLLSTLRTRRMGRGYRMESGESETFAWASGNAAGQPKGPLAYCSDKEPEPLTEVEEALIAWAGLGPNGIVTADIPVHGDLSSLQYWAGRTAPGSSNDNSVDLMIINDEGVHLYRPGTERSKPVEIEGPNDYWKILQWYRNGRIKVSDHRPDVDWSVAPPGTHNVRPMGPLQYNLNRPGSTWFLPVGDLGREWFNLLLSSYHFSGFYLQDTNGNKPAGCDEWIRPGFLEVGFPIPVFDELVLMMHASQVAAVVQNMRLACEALGLGGWTLGNYSDDMVLGAYPDVAKGLGFEFLDREPDKNPSRAATCLGLADVFEAICVPTRWCPNAASAIERVMESRYGASGILKREQRGLGPYKAEAMTRVLEDSKMYVPDWVIEAASDTVEYIVREYGCAPAYISPVRAKFSLQVHHLDEGFYQRYYEGAEHPFPITREISEHFDHWHDEEA